MSYTAPKQKYEDLKSSASAFLFVGGGATILSLLCWFDVIQLPFQGASNIMFQSMLFLMGIASLVGSLLTYHSAKKVQSTMDSEESQTQQILTWFQSQYTNDGIDSTVIREFPDIKQDELNLKRMEFIQDRLITSQDLPNPSYVDALTEEIYENLYEN